MLRLTGRLADGTITWMTGNKTLADLTVPQICGAVEEAGRPKLRCLPAFQFCAPMTSTQEWKERRKFGKCMGLCRANS